MEKSRFRTLLRTVPSISTKCPESVLTNSELDVLRMVNVKSARRLFIYRIQPVNANIYAFCNTYHEVQFSAPTEVFRERVKLTVS